MSTSPEPETDDGLPDGAFVASIAGFPGMTIGRLRSLLDDRPPALAFDIATGSAAPPAPIAELFRQRGGLAAQWQLQRRRRDPRRCWERCLESGIAVVTPADPSFPNVLRDDPARPAALFVRGDLAALDSRRVGIVGTRNATQRGRQTAARFGQELAVAGVCVVSGLARGVDGAAHRGALSVAGARPVAVVGNGPDRPYPQQHRDLWDEVARRGAVISEWPPGTAPDAYRFPLRNRILAALCEVLVVVESRERGGSLITAVEAAHRGVEVFAVPGAVDSPSSQGTNRLLSEGAGTAIDPTAILVELGLDTRRAGSRRFDPRPAVRGVEQLVVDACRGQARTLDALLEVTGTTLADTAMVAARLAHLGWLRETAGWFEAVDEWGDLA